MEPIIGIIESVEDALDYNQKDFKKVTLVGGQVLNVKYGQGGTLKAKWGILVAGVAIKFTMKPYTVPSSGAVVPIVQDIETVAEGLASPVKVEASEAVTGVTTIHPPPPKPVPAPQAVGMWTKELGDMLRADKLEIVFGTENALQLLGWYRKQAASITQLNVEGVR